jgi:hypothetical protein
MKNSLTADRPLPDYSRSDRQSRRSPEQHPRRSPTERWGGNEILFSEGFLSVPTKFLRRYSSLNPPISSGEALFVLQIMTFKWESAAPFPTYKRIAKAMGVTDKMVRRYAQQLQKKGYLVRQFQYRAPNRFDLTGLFEALAKTP